MFALEWLILVTTICYILSQGIYIYNLSFAYMKANLRVLLPTITETEIQLFNKPIFSYTLNDNVYYSHSTDTDDILTGESNTKSLINTAFSYILNNNAYYSYNTETDNILTNESNT